MREDEGEDLRREAANMHTARSLLLHHANRERTVVCSGTCAAAVPLALFCWALRIVAAGLAASIHVGGIATCRCQQRVALNALQAAAAAAADAKLQALRRDCLVVCQALSSVGIMPVCGSVAIGVQEQARMSSGVALIVEVAWAWRLPTGLPQGHLRPDTGVLGVKTDDTIRQLGESSKTATAEQGIATGKGTTCSNRHTCLV